AALLGIAQIAEQAQRHGVLLLAGGDHVVIADAARGQFAGAGQGFLARGRRRQKDAVAAQAGGLHLPVLDAGNQRRQRRHGGTQLRRRLEGTDAQAGRRVRQRQRHGGGLGLLGRQRRLDLAQQHQAGHAGGQRRHGRRRRRRMQPPPQGHAQVHAGKQDNQTAQDHASSSSVTAA